MFYGPWSAAIRLFAESVRDMKRSLAIIILKMNNSSRVPQDLKEFYAQIYDQASPPKANSLDSRKVNAVLSRVRRLRQFKLKTLSDTKLDTARSREPRLADRTGSFRSGQETPAALSPTPSYDSASVPHLVGTLLPLQVSVTRCRNVQSVLRGGALSRVSDGFRTTSGPFLPRETFAMTMTMRQPASTKGGWPRRTQSRAQLVTPEQVGLREETQTCRTPAPRFKVLAQRGCQSTKRLVVIASPAPTKSPPHHAPDRRLRFSEAMMQGYFSDPPRTKPSEEEALDVNIAEEKQRWYDARPRLIINRYYRNNYIPRGTTTRVKSGRLTVARLWQSALDPSRQEPRLEPEMILRLIRECSSGNGEAQEKSSPMRTATATTVSMRQILAGERRKLLLAQGLRRCKSISPAREPRRLLKA